MEIVFYQEKYKQAFIDLNLAWLNEYFTVEPQDTEMFNGIEDLIRKGAAVYFAVENGAAIAACMILPRENNIWEVCKLAADERYRGKGAGHAVLKACMDYAAGHGAEKIMIVSNRILTAAMGLYAKMGFHEIPLSYKEYDRVNIQLEYKVTDR